MCFCSHHVAVTLARPGRGVAWGVQTGKGEQRRFTMAYGNEKSISQASAKGKVKWFNATKGYGFVTLDNGGDAFCHASALQATGHSDVPPGTTIVCDLADSQRGLQVVSVHTSGWAHIGSPSAPEMGRSCEGRVPSRRPRGGGSTAHRSPPCSASGA